LSAPPSRSISIVVSPPEYGFDDVRPDLTEALKWYELAARHGVAEIDAKLQRLRPRVRAKMSDAQIAAALDLAADWVPATRH
jgi:TPR repeat protein